MRAAAHGHAPPEIGPRSADTPAPADRVAKAPPPQAVAASPCDALSGRAKTRCEANERALARRCASGRRTAECVEYAARSEEHTPELQSLMRISYAVFCLQKI